MHPETHDPAIARAFGDAIREAREQAGHTRRSFADRAGVDDADYAAIERGEHDLKLDEIVRIAAALRVTVAELFRHAKL